MYSPGGGFPLITFQVRVLPVFILIHRYLIFEKILFEMFYHYLLRFGDLFSLSSGRRE